MGTLNDIKQLPGAFMGAVRAKMQLGSVNAKLHDKLMTPFPEGIVGLKNMATISDTISNHINSGYPERAIAYAKDQQGKIQQQTSAARTAKMKPRY